MRAAVGDHISVPGRHVGDGTREGEVEQVQGDDDLPLYLVHWEDGHRGLCSLGPEAKIFHR